MSQLGKSVWLVRIKKGVIDQERLLAYLLRCNLTTQHICGLLLDALDLPI